MLLLRRSPPPRRRPGSHRKNARFNVQEEKIAKVIKASGNEVESYWPGLFAKALEGQDIAKLLTAIGSAGPAAAPAAGAAAAAADGKPNALIYFLAGEKKEDKKKQDEDAGDVDMGGLFGDEDY